MFENVTIIESSLELATPEEVTEAETLLNLKFPDGYRKYVTRFGNGAFCQYVRVFMPSLILTEYKVYQAAWNDIFLSEAGRVVLPKEKIVESVIWADTFCGDQILFHPDNPHQSYLLPEDEDMIYRLSSDVDKVLDSLCGTKNFEFSIPTAKQYFVPESWYRANRGKIWEGNL